MAPAPDRPDRLDRPDRPAAPPQDSTPRRQPPALWVDLALMAVLAVLAVFTAGLSEAGRRLPIATIAVLLVLLILDLVVQLRRRAAGEPATAPAAPAEVASERPLAAPVEGEPVDDAVAPREVDQTADESPDEAPGLGREVTVLLWLLGAGVGIYLLDYVIAVPIFLAAFFLLHRVRAAVWVPVTAAVSALMYFGFHRYLGL